MSKREHDSATSSSIASALSKGSKGKKARYSDAGEMTSADVWGVNREKSDAQGEDGAPMEKAYKPNFGLSGALSKDAATVEQAGGVLNGVSLKYSAPPEKVLPTRPWRLYVFKGEDLLDTLHLTRHDHYLLGRDERVADIETAHGSCSEQHAVLQFRRVLYSGSNPKHKGKRVCKLFLIDLESTNGTYLNGEKIDSRRYYEVKEKDCMRCGESGREYVFLVEGKKK